MFSKLLTRAAGLLLLIYIGGAVAQTGVSETRLRDELLRHFSHDNLVPVFLPRNHEVGDVMDASGAVYAKWTDCFPTLKVAQQRPSDTLRQLALDLKAEGNFGIGLKRILDIMVSAKASTSTRLTIFFNEQTYVSASTNQLRKAYSKKNCPFLADIVDGKAVPAAKLGRPLLVLQEVFYAKKRLSIAIDKGADVQAALKKIEGVVSPLDATLGLGVRHMADNRIDVVAERAVPIAARIGFLPLPITGTTLGAGGSNEIQKYYWQPSQHNPDSDTKGMKVVYAAMLEATSGKDNPLLADD